MKILYTLDVNRIYLLIYPDALSGLLPLELFIEFLLLFYAYPDST
jgi:hypothetical protein